MPSTVTTIMLCDRLRVELAAHAPRTLIALDRGDERAIAVVDDTAVRVADRARAPARLEDVVEPQLAPPATTGARRRTASANSRIDVANVRTGRRQHRDEAAEHVLHHRDDERVAIGEVDVERAARPLRSRADRVEADVEAVRAELVDPRGDQRVAGRLLGLRAGLRRHLR